MVSWPVVIRRFSPPSAAGSRWRRPPRKGSGPPDLALHGRAPIAPGCAGGRRRRPTPRAASITRHGRAGGAEAVERGMVPEDEDRGSRRPSQGRGRVQGAAEAVPRLAIAAGGSSPSHGRRRGPRRRSRRRASRASPSTAQERLPQHRPDLGRRRSTSRRGCRGRAPSGPGRRSSQARSGWTSRWFRAIDTSPGQQDQVVRGRPRPRHSRAIFSAWSRQRPANRSRGSSRANERCRSEIAQTFMVGDPRAGDRSRSTRRVDRTTGPSAACPRRPARQNGRDGDPGTSRADFAVSLARRDRPHGPDPPTRRAGRDAPALGATSCSSTGRSRSRRSAAARARRGWRSTPSRGRPTSGLVPFTMTGVRPMLGTAGAGAVELPRGQRPHLRPLRGRDPGVWFFSLDAAQALAVPHRPAVLEPPVPLRPDGAWIATTDGAIAYRSDRLWPGPAPARCDLAYEPRARPRPRRPGRWSTSWPSGTSCTPGRAGGCSGAGPPLALPAAAGPGAPPGRDLAGRLGDRPPAGRAAGPLRQRRGRAGVSAAEGRPLRIAHRTRPGRGGISRETRP